MFTLISSTKYSSLDLNPSLWGDSELIDEINQSKDKNLNKENNVSIDSVNQNGVKIENIPIFTQTEENEMNTELLNLFKSFCNQMNNIAHTFSHENVIVGEVLKAPILAEVLSSDTSQIIIGEVVPPNKNGDEVVKRKNSQTKEETISPLYSPIPFSSGGKKKLSFNVDEEEDHELSEKEKKKKENENKLFLTSCEFPSIEEAQKIKKKNVHVSLTSGKDTEIKQESKLLCMNLLKFGKCTRLLCESNHNGGMKKCNFGKECNKVCKSKDGKIYNIDYSNRCFFIHPDESKDMFFSRHKINNELSNNKVALCKFGLSCLKVKRKISEGKINYSGYECTFLHPNETVENYKIRRINKY